MVESTKSFKHSGLFVEPVIPPFPVIMAGVSVDCNSYLVRQFHHCSSIMLIRLEFLTKYLVGLRSGRPENKLHVESVFLLGLSPGVSGESYLLPSFGTNITDLTLAVLQCLVTHLYRIEDILSNRN